MNDLQTLGYDDWFAQRADPAQLQSHDLARVISVQRESYIIRKNGSGDVGSEIYAQLAGNLLYGASSSLDLPTTGDWVYSDCYDDDTHAIIFGVLPRKTLLKRKTAGKQVDYQLIAANIDVAFIIQSLNENFNLRRLERYLVMINDAGIKPRILLSKADLVSEAERESVIEQVRSIAPDTELLTFSNLDTNSIAAITALLKKGMTYCLLGSSGVGKTTLLNSLVGEQAFATQTVSKVESKGRHTTTSRHLVMLDSGAMIIDTPGMRELGAIAVDEGLDETFSEIGELASQCKFSDCTHSNEKGCAVLAAIERGELEQDRYQNYLKMKKESDFYQMSYRDKKKKDKQLGKLIKSVLKNKRH